jgi:uncharacterized protein YxjI
MNPILTRNLFFVKEHVGMFKASSNYDILDPESNEMIMTCREPNLGFFAKIFRFTKYKRMTPFDIQIKDTQGNDVCTVKRGVSIFISKVDIHDETGAVVGRLKQKFFSFGGKFDVFDANDQKLCQLKGKWTGWYFKFVNGDNEYAHITKKWAGLGKELFTTADNYVLSISETVPADDKMRIVILGAVMCIDMVLKE